MGKSQNIVTPLHQETRRDYVGRMMDEKVHCMLIAKQYNEQYWDGERRYGYGGYKYIAGRWKPVAEKLIEDYNLTNNSSVLDVGCGKGFLLYELKLLLPELEIRGFDISKHALNSSKELIKPFLFRHKAQDSFPFKKNKFDLVVSLGALHNLRLFELKKALGEIERVSKQSYIMLESYRNEQELFNLQCWALTAESFFDVEEWLWIYKEFNYTGDYEFIFFE